jgi:hypothetical protein
VRMEWQTTAAYPRWRSRTAVSAYQSVLIALAAADNAALLLDGHLVTAAAAVARDEPDAAAGVADEGRDPCPSPQQYSLYHRGGTGTGRSRSQLPDPSTPPTRRPGGWSSHWSAGPVGWLGRRPPREPAQHPSHRGREPGGRQTGMATASGKRAPPAQVHAISRCACAAKPQTTRALPASDCCRVPYVQRLAVWFKLGLDWTCLIWGK